MMIGFIKPIVLLPDHPYSDNELRLVFMHELTHYKRMDLWYKIITMFATAVHWFNPVVHFMSKAITVECEISCDEQVLRNADTMNRKLYGQMIVNTARSQSARFSPLSTHFNNSLKEMKNRIVAICDTTKKRTSMSVLLSVIIIIAGAGLVRASNQVRDDFDADVEMEIMQEEAAFADIPPVITYKRILPVYEKSAQYYTYDMRICTIDLDNPEMYEENCVYTNIETCADFEYQKVASQIYSRFIRHSNDGARNSAVISYMLLCEASEDKKITKNEMECIIIKCREIIASFFIMENIESMTVEYMRQIMDKDVIKRLAQTFDGIEFTIDVYRCSPFYGIIAAK